MQMVMAPSAGEVGRTGAQAAATPARLTTTLYDLITAIQEVVGTGNDALVVATVVHLLRSGWLTVPGTARTSRRMRPWSHL
jgi:hypothetical protein